MVSSGRCRSGSGSAEFADRNMSGGVGSSGGSG